MQQPLTYQPPPAQQPARKSILLSMAESLLFLTFLAIPVGLVSQLPVVEAALGEVPGYLQVGAFILLPSALMAVIFRKPTMIISFAKYYLSAMAAAAALWGVLECSDKGIGEALKFVFAVGIGFIWNLTEGIGKVLSVIGILFYVIGVLLALLCTIVGLMALVNTCVIHLLDRLLARNKTS